jgi:uncharacterized membrane protein YgcG
VVWLEVGLMVVGMICAAVFTMARVLGSEESGQSRALLTGVVICCASLFCASLNTTVAGVLGNMKMGVFDTVAYMSLPSVVFLIVPSVLAVRPLPGEWSAAFGSLNDMQILSVIWSYNKRAAAWLVLSGPLSFAYNVVQVAVVQMLAPAAEACAGTMNKALIILASLLIPSLRVSPLPGMPYIAWIWASAVLNVSALAWYSYLQIAEKMRADRQKSGGDGGDGGDGDDGGESEEGSGGESEGGSGGERRRNLKVFVCDFYGEMKWSAVP